MPWSLPLKHHWHWHTKMGSSYKHESRRLPIRLRSQVLYRKFRWNNFRGWWRRLSKICGSWIRLLRSDYLLQCMEWSKIENGHRMDEQLGLCQQGAYRPLERANVLPKRLYPSDIPRQDLLVLKSNLGWRSPTHSNWNRLLLWLQIQLYSYPNQLRP